MTERQELLDATDETIEDAVRFADPMVLRGLLYQLTGDDSVAATEVHGRVLGLVEAMVLANASDAELLQSKAAEFLKSYRDSGADDIPVGPARSAADEPRASPAARRSRRPTWSCGWSSSPSTRGREHSPGATSRSRSGCRSSPWW